MAFIGGDECKHLLVLPYHTNNLMEQPVVVSENSVHHSNVKEYEEYFTTSYASPSSKHLKYLNEKTSQNPLTTIPCSSQELTRDVEVNLISSRVGQLPSRISRDHIASYKKRWFMLFIFSMNTMMSGLLFVSLSPINNITLNYYRVQSLHIEWLSNMFMIAYTVLALPCSYLMSRCGVRPVIITASTLHFISTSLHYAGYHRDRFLFVLCGQGFAAIGYSMILQIPGKLSSVWFPEKEGATATSIGVFMNLFGISVGFLQPSMMIRETDNIETMRNGLSHLFQCQLYMAGLILLLTLAYEEQPPTPARTHTYREGICFTTSLKLLWRNRDFMLFAQSYGIYFGLFVTFSVLVNPLVTTTFPRGYDVCLGWMGFSCDLAAMLACLIIGMILDIYHVYSLTAILLNMFSTLLWLLFVLVLTSTTNFELVFGLYVALGVFGVPYFASGIEQCAEMTYPVSEETSSTLILMFGNLYGFVFVAILGFEAELHHIKMAGYTMVLLYSVSTLLTLLTKTELKRSNKNNHLYSLFD